MHREEASTFRAFTGPRMLLQHAVPTHPSRHSTSRPEYACVRLMPKGSAARDDDAADRARCAICVRAASCTQCGQPQITCPTFISAISGLHLGQQDDVGSGWDNLLILLLIVVVEIGFLPDLSALPRSHEDRTESEKHPIAPPMTKFGSASLKTSTIATRQIVSATTYLAIFVPPTCELQVAVEHRAQLAALTCKRSHKVNAPPGPALCFTETSSPWSSPPSVGRQEQLRTTILKTQSCIVAYQRR